VAVVTDSILRDEIVGLATAGETVNKGVTIAAVVKRSLKLRCYSRF